MARDSIGPAQGAYPSPIEEAIPVPLVCVRNWERKPIMPRAGTTNSIRTQPEPWFDIVSIRPLRAAMICVTAPRYSSGTSIVVRSMGSCTLPSTVFVTTRGLPTVNSNPSRRICSTRIANASSPRSWTSHWSGRSVGSTLIETFPTSSASSRSLTWRAVSLCPFTLPAKGESLMPTVIEIAGSSTCMGGSGRGSSKSTKQSPIVMSSTPAIATMSPARALCVGSRFSPLVASSSDMCTRESAPSFPERPTQAPFVSSPE